ncbi:ankyrin repeat-containing domain protein [Russula earlei]|uniref:Ankyrin repeat-containing domain protein n=1 Tax=Russula earlei TaxID=71964 RepID=A0ACC0U513_9AGAM|nr:ankyrin repeat-containing domain protein [Russula earlei]
MQRGGVRVLRYYYLSMGRTQVFEMRMARFRYMRPHFEGRLELVERLLELGVDVNSRDNQGRTPLHGHGADSCVRDEDGQTPLHVASQEGSLKLVEPLLELGVDVNSWDGQGRTPLQMVGPRNKRATEKLLLRYGAGRT